MQYLSSARGRGLAALAAGLALSACADQPTGTPSAGPPEVPFGVVYPVDNSINQSDTWVSFDATRDQSTTITTQEPVYDARTAQYTTTVAAELPPQGLHAEAGYDSYGTVRYNEYRQVSSADPTESIVDPTSRVQVVGQQVTVYDEYNQPTQAVNPDDPSVPPLEELGSLSGAQITQAVVLDHEPANGAAIMTSLAPTGSGAVTRVRRLSPNRVAVETSLSETLPAASVAALPGAAQGASRQDARVTRIYGRRGDRWVLEELEATGRTQAGANSMEHTQRTRLRNVRWHENKEKDEARKKQREAHKADGPSMYYQPVDNCTDDPCITDPPPSEPPPPPPPPSPCDGAAYNGRHVVFQHGIFAQADTWGTMPTKVANDFYIGCKLKPNLDSNERLAYQANQLSGHISSLGKGPLLLIGHSQGGLIGRYVAQHSPHLVNGVVTIGTPHRGAPIAHTSKLMITGVLSVPAAMIARGCSSWRGIRCGAARTVQTMIPVLAMFGTDPAVPAFQDLRPNSTFTQTLNGTAEYFPRAGIQYTPSRIFVEWRVAGDFFQDNGSGFVNIAWVALAVSTGCSAIGWIIGFHSAATNCAFTAGGLLALDLAWNVLTAGLASSDGIVPYSSQVYPNANRNVRVSNGSPSHTGETESGATRTALRPVLRDVMGVQARVSF